jgi:hypothetical protein
LVRIGLYFGKQQLAKAQLQPFRCALDEETLRQNQGMVNDGSETSHFRDYATDGNCNDPKSSMSNRMRHDIQKQGVRIALPFVDAVHLSYSEIRSSGRKALQPERLSLIRSKTILIS